MSQLNRRNRASVSYRGSQENPTERIASHPQQSAGLAKASGRAVSPLVRRKTIQDAQLGRPRNDYDRRRISNNRPNIGADLALPPSTLGPGTNSYLHSNATLYSGTPPSGHVATNAVTQIPMYQSPRQSRHTRNGSYTKHPVVSPVSIVTNISSPPPSIRSPTAARSGRTRRTTTTTTTTDAPSLLLSSNPPSSLPTSTMDNGRYWSEPHQLDGHSFDAYGNITSVTSSLGLAHMPAQYSHGELYNYDGMYSPAHAASERGLPAVAPPGGKIAAASHDIGFLSLPPSTDDQRPVASVAEGPHTNVGLSRHPDAYHPQYSIDHQTYSPPNPAAYYNTFAPDPMSTTIQIHPRSPHMEQPYIQGTPNLVPYYSHPARSPAMPPHSSPQQNPNSHSRYPGYALPGPDYVNYSANGLVSAPDFNTIIDVNHKVYMPAPFGSSNGVIGSPLPQTSPSEPPSDFERSQTSPALRNSTRFPGQRLDVDQQLLDASFCGHDEDSRKRRAILDEILGQPWYYNHEQEPRIESLSDPAARGLGMVGRSIYTVFLVQDENGSHWRCLFGGHHAQCDRSEKQFERVERAIEHVRRHLGHRPYACDDGCLKSQTSGAPCGQRFFASQYLQDHKRRPQKRKSTAQS
ncbi:hypothetical protein PIIN_08164 [Serendipita indica DSM 11827]|uniref:C2H2-type domain-containing protein n=1 Tax=Serendipita indica (strain DSM 11827) TaxID=1109443 RepID=G4TSB8_SERID|nr:hypothetical protein PIIN_08164 [Serendipita indica DSM 11827]